MIAYKGCRRGPCAGSRKPDLQPGPVHSSTRIGRGASSSSVSGDPAELKKAGREHRVQLSDRATEILKGDA